MNWDLDLEQPYCQTVDRDPSARWSVTSNKKLFLVRPCPECTEAKCYTPRSSPHTPPDPVLPALLRSTFSQWKLWAAVCIPARVTEETGSTLNILGRVLSLNDQRGNTGIHTTSVQRWRKEAIYSIMTHRVDFQNLRMLVLRYLHFFFFFSDRY